MSAPRGPAQLFVRAQLMFVRARVPPHRCRSAAAAKKHARRAICCTLHHGTAAARRPRRTHTSRAARAAALIRSKGDQQLTVEELTSEIQPHGRATVPDEVKADLLQRIRRFVEDSAA